MARSCTGRWASSLVNCSLDAIQLGLPGPSMCGASMRHFLSLKTVPGGPPTKETNPPGIVVYAYDDDGTHAWGRQINVVVSVSGKIVSHSFAPPRPFTGLIYEFCVVESCACRSQPWICASEWSP